jgi:glycosyltransferase involved in cell wall biosynthesis
MPSISVLIRLYNGVEYLSDSLKSVLDQTFTDWELLIGVNGHGANGGDKYRLDK